MSPHGTALLYAYVPFPSRQEKQKLLGRKPD
jgi:hypothetical protein